MNTFLDLITIFLGIVGLALIAGGIGFALTDKIWQPFIVAFVGFLMLLFSIDLYKARNTFTCDTDYVERLNKEVRLHYPSLRMPLHETRKKNDLYGLTVGEYKDFKNQMKIIDEGKLNMINGVEF